MCSACQGYVGVSCPVCGKGSLQEKTCPKCKGLGHTGYYAFDVIKRVDVKMSEADWLLLPDEEDEAIISGMRYCKQEVDICSKCGGEGVIYER